MQFSHHCRFTFECKYECATTPEITWFKDGVALKSADYIIQCKDGHCTLTIEETFADDTATYVCKATTSAGSSETKASLKVRGTSQTRVTAETMTFLNFPAHNPSFISRTCASMM